MIYIKIPVDYYLGLLKDRFEVCEKRGWVGDEQRELWPLVF